MISAVIASVRSTVVALSVLLVGASLVAQSPVAERLAPIDVDGDGKAEVRSLQRIASAGDPASSLVLVLVERRLLTPRKGIAAARRDGLRARLHRLGQDLADAGCRAEVLSVDVYSGPRHQDGRTVLGIRRLLQAYAGKVELAGALLVGHFPDAKLVRTCNWRKKCRVSLPDQNGKKVAFPGRTRWLRRVPELVAHKCDLVLADLDGHWEKRYIGEPRGLERVEAVFAGAEHLAAGGPCAALRVSQMTYRDVFHVADGAVTVDRHGFTVEIDDTIRDHECTDLDRKSRNSIAQPEIAISRIDARGSAWSPKPEFLDSDGQPRRVAFRNGSKIPRWNTVWQPDPSLELRLLCEYLDRNHDYRTKGIPPDAHKPASIAWGLGSGIRSLRRADASWASFNEPGYDVSKKVDLQELVAWLRRPALLRTLRAHSNGRFAAFARTDVNALEKAIGGTPWSFTRRGNALVPSLRSACRAGHANFFLYRTLWENKALPSAPYVLLHTGCESISPPNHQRAFDDPSYGARQQAEALLFYTPCLAIVGRAKVFYDEPRGFSETLRRGGTVGDAWRRYFAIEATAKTWSRVGGDIGRKRSYFWSILGDWTLRMPAVK